MREPLREHVRLLLLAEALKMRCYVSSGSGTLKKNKKTLEYCHVNMTVREKSPFCMFNVHSPFLSILAVTLNIYEANTAGVRIKDTQKDKQTTKSRGNQRRYLKDFKMSLERNQTVCK